MLQRTNFQWKVNFELTIRSSLTLLSYLCSIFNLCSLTFRRLFINMHFACLTLPYPQCSFNWQVDAYEVCMRQENNFWKYDLVYLFLIIYLHDMTLFLYFHLYANPPWNAPGGIARKKRQVWQDFLKRLKFVPRQK